MNQIKLIRDKLGISQSELGAGIGVTQGNVSFYETNQQSVPPDVARRLIAFAKSKRLPLTFDHVYSAIALPDLAKPKRKPAKVEG